MTHLVHIEIDDAGAPSPTPVMEQERRVAIFDLLEKNQFDVPAAAGVIFTGPYKLILSIRQRRLVFEVTTETDQQVAEFQLSLVPFRQVVKDYFQICESYFEAAKTMPPSQIETIDMARRGIHNEGARILQERLEGKLVMDTDTARRLFTLICVLHWGV